MWDERPQTEAERKLQEEGATVRLDERSKWDEWASAGSKKEEQNPRERGNPDDDWEYNERMRMQGRADNNGYVNVDFTKCVFIAQGFGGNSANGMSCQPIIQGKKKMLAVESDDDICKFAVSDEDEKYCTDAIGGFPSK